MGYKTILCHLADDDGVEGRLRLAKALAARFGGAIEALHVTPPTVVPVGLAEGTAYIAAGIQEALQAAAARTTERMKAVYRDVCEPVTVPSRWVHAEGDIADALIAAARTADLTLSALHAESGLDALPASVVEQVILGAGGPVLLVPFGWAGTEVGRRVIVGWKGSRESARAVHDALPFLTGAASVVVAGAGAEAPRGLDGIVALLGRHGATARAELVADPAGPADALLQLATAEGADLLVMGAYGRTRLRELVLGGATRDILRTATIPVLFSC
ncbi:MAG: universal stress protein [Geminicoccaceae bacterium]